MKDRRPVQASLRGELRFPPKRALGLRPAAITALAAFLIGGSASAFAAPPGAPIDNRATLRFENAASAEVVINSNDVQLITAVTRSPSSIVMTRIVPSGDFEETVGPAFCAAGGGFTPLPNPTLPGAGVVDPTTPQQMSPTDSFNLGEPVFVRLDDSDQNVDYQVIDTATVTLTNSSSGDSETIRLSETGPNTGIFSGYLANRKRQLWLAAIACCKAQWASR